MLIVSSSDAPFLVASFKDVTTAHLIFAKLIVMLASAYPCWSSHWNGSSYLLWECCWDTPLRPNCFSAEQCDAIFRPASVGQAIYMNLFCPPVWKEVTRTLFCLPAFLRVTRMFLFGSSVWREWDGPLLSSYFAAVIWILLCSHLFQRVSGTFHSLPPYLKELTVHSTSALLDVNPPPPASFFLRFQRSSPLCLCCCVFSIVHLLHCSVIYWYCPACPS